MINSVIQTQKAQNDQSNYNSNSYRAKDSEGRKSKKRNKLHHQIASKERVKDTYRDETSYKSPEDFSEGLHREDLIKNDSNPLISHNLYSMREPLAVNR